MSTKIIEMTADIKNPFKDGRSKDWNKLPVIEKGRRFIVTLSSIWPAKGMGFEPVNGELARLMLANSKEVPPVSPKEMAAVFDVDFGGDELMRILIKLGRIGPADFEAIAKAVEADENF